MSYPLFSGVVKLADAEFECQAGSENGNFKLSNLKSEIENLKS
jgi:hypothetical protein